MVVADIDEPFLPSPGGLLVNLDENRAIEKLLLDFPSYFENNANQGFALGPALKAGHKMISNIGVNWYVLLPLYQISVKVS